MTLSRNSCFCLILFLLLRPDVYAHWDSIPRNNDTALHIHSNVLNERRSIWVHLPADYRVKDEPYPVLYLLDGEGHFKYVSELVEYLSGYDRNRTSPMIVVGIVNENRGKDLHLVHPLVNGKKDSSSILTTAGGGKFLQFIQSELVPKIDSCFRTAPYRILMGHSLAGQFALYAKVKAPDLFTGTILISPAIHDGNERLMNDLGGLLKQPEQRSEKIVFTIGNENTEKVEQLAEELKTCPRNSVDWKYQYYPDENHFSVTYKSMFDGLKFIYKNWFIDTYGTVRMTYKDIQQHFDKLSKEFGYTIKPGEEFVNACGYKQLRSGNVDAAMELFKENVRNYPNSWNVYDSMGEAYMKKGETKLAVENYERSIALNPGNEDGREMLKKLKSASSPPSDNKK
jgi:predicted alpha/beta superfamily hydrolase